MVELLDGCGRRVDHLRLSVTPVCDLRCVYCRPRGGVQPVSTLHDDGGLPAADCGSGGPLLSHSKFRELATLRSARPATLSDDQRCDLVRFLCERHGLRQVRLTGGEPLMYPRVVELISVLRSSARHVMLAMTTNGTRLADRAAALRRAGLDRLNVSLDSLDSQRYRRITGGCLDDVLAGIECAVAAGFPPPKINTVVLRGLNDDEVRDLARWALRRGSEIRFLEAMPIGPAAAVNRARFVSASEVRRTLESAFRLTPMSRGRGETSMRFRAEDDCVSGVIGLIAPVTAPFCGDCRRIRVTADGLLYPCLMDERHTDLHDAWPAGLFDEFIASELLRSALAEKSAQGPTRQAAVMVRLGG